MKRLMASVLVALLAGVLLPASLPPAAHASATLLAARSTDANSATGVQVVPGSVSAVLNSTSGSSSFTTGAVAAGWSPTASITVEYKYFNRPYATQPWRLIDTQSRTCSGGVTSCSVPSSYRTYNGYAKVEARAWGAGGAAENNPSVKSRTVGNPPSFQTSP